MKKRVSGVLLCALLCGALMAGCGKKEEQQAAEYYQNELGMSQDDAKELANEVYGEPSVGKESSVEETKQETKETEKATEAEVSSETEQQESTETAPQKEYEIFPPSPEWEGEIEKYFLYSPVQIDDTLYENNDSVSYFLELVESSVIDYTYEYNPDKLVAPNEEVPLVIYRDGVEWFSTECHTGSESAAPLSECWTGFIKVSDEAYRYARFIDGRSFDEILKMTYSDVKELKDLPLMSEYYTIEEKDGGWLNYSDDGRIFHTKDELDDCLCVSLSVKLRASSKHEYTVKEYMFLVDKNTSQVVDFARAFI